MTANKSPKVWVRWSPVQDAKLLELVKAGTKVVQISKVLGTTQSGIRGRLARIKPKDELLSMSQEDQKCAIRWHQEGISFTEIAHRLQKRLHIVVTAITTETGKHIGESEATRPWTWGHVPRARTTSSHNGAPHDDERESSPKGSI